MSCNLADDLGVTETVQGGHGSPDEGESSSSSSNSRVSQVADGAQKKTEFGGGCWDWMWMWSKGQKDYLLRNFKVTREFC